ncbi:hypothetical protein EV702DRAFT_679836 [Suillus placidus]|uniref:Secreted protein n=1 Tax=Suillus placidus TaxID=48579 RepID=A0A9P7A1S4_9AGAM|nr:hypothetical protein EV702DRAFT_679836 [Suillus placidus]
MRDVNWLVLRLVWITPSSGSVKGTSVCTFAQGLCLSGLAPERVTMELVLGSRCRLCQSLLGLRRGYVTEPCYSLFLSVTQSLQVARSVELLLQQQNPFALHPLRCHELRYTAAPSTNIIKVLDRALSRPKCSSPCNSSPSSFYLGLTFDFGATF